MHHHDVEKQNANHLLNVLMKERDFKNDAALCLFLELSPPQLSKIRHNRLSVSANIVIQIMIKTGKSLEEVYGLLYHPKEPATA